MDKSRPLTWGRLFVAWAARDLAPPAPGKSRGARPGAVRIDQYRLDADDPASACPGTGKPACLQNAAKRGSFRYSSGNGS